MGRNYEECGRKDTGVAIKHVEEGVIISEIAEALQLYASEAAQRYEEDLTLPVDAYRQPEAPWP
jgi:hypothetical protein